MSASMRIFVMPKGVPLDLYSHFYHVYHDTELSATGDRARAMLEEFRNKPQFWKDFEFLYELDIMTITNLIGSKNEIVKEIGRDCLRLYSKLGEKYKFFIEF